MHQENPCPLARNREVNCIFSFEVLFHPPTHLSSLVTTVSHPLGPTLTLTPTQWWTYIKPDHAKDIAAPVPECIYKCVWILYLIPKCEPTSWVRALGFSILSVELVTHHSSQLQSSEPQNQGKERPPLSWWSVWEHPPVQLGSTEPEPTQKGSHEPCCRLFLVEHPAECLKVPQGPLPCSSFLDRTLHSGAGTLPAYLALCLVNIFHFILTIPVMMEDAEQPQSLVWDTGANKEVSKGEGRKTCLLLVLEWLSTDAINKRKCVGCFLLLVCKLYG